MMGELTFFLGIQVKQTKHGTFVYQAKYTKDLLKRFNMAELKPVSTPMSTAMSLGPDEDGEAVDQREYRSMIDSLLCEIPNFVKLSYLVQTIFKSPNQKS
jgi:hypothetical protein